MNQPHKPTGDTLYFDGACPVCRREVKHLKERADEQLNFVDIHESPLSEDQKAQLSQQLHLKTDQGTWLTGLEANVQAWQHTPSAKLARLLLSRPIRPFAEAGYRLWLKVYHRQRRRREQSKSL